MSRSTATKRVFLTGATGIMGRAVLRELVDRADRLEVVALVLPTPHDRQAIAEFQDARNLSLVYGDLTRYADVERCVRGADYVLHTAALVSPAADEQPELTMRVNVDGVRNIIRAVKARDDPDSVGVVMIGSVAETGDRNPPHHWGRVGDPLKPAVFDIYAQSKIAAERELVDSGLRRWARSRRRTSTATGSPTPAGSMTFCTSAPRRSRKPSPAPRPPPPPGCDWPDASRRAWSSGGSSNR